MISVRVHLFHIAKRHGKSWKAFVIIPVHRFLSIFNNFFNGMHFVHCFMWMLPMKTLVSVVNVNNDCLNSQNSWVFNINYKKRHYSQ